MEKTKTIIIPKLKCKFQMIEWKSGNSYANSHIFITIFGINDLNWIKLQLIFINHNYVAAFPSRLDIKSTL